MPTAQRRGSLTGLVATAIVVGCLMAAPETCRAQPPAPPDSSAARPPARDIPFRQAPRVWFVSLGGGVTQGDQAFQSSTNLFATASVARLVGRNIVLGVVGSWMPSSQSGAFGCTAGGCAGRSKQTSSVFEVAGAFRFASFGPQGLGPYAEVAPGVFFGHWTREEQPLGSPTTSRSVDEIFLGIHFGIVFPITLGPRSGVELGARYIYTEEVNLAPLLGLEGNAGEGLRQFQFFGALAHRF